MNTLVKKSFLAGIGLLSMTHDRAREVLDELGQQGEDQKSEVKEWVDQLADRGEEERQAFRALVSTEVKNALSEMGIATKEDLQKLEKSVGRSKAKAQAKKTKTAGK